MQFLKIALASVLAALAVSSPTERRQSSAGDQVSGVTFSANFGADDQTEINLEGQATFGPPLGTVGVHCDNYQSYGNNPDQTFQLRCDNPAVKAKFENDGHSGLIYVTAVVQQYRAVLVFTAFATPTGTVYDYPQAQVTGTLESVSS